MPDDRRKDIVTDPQLSPQADDLGPIDFLAVEFPSGRVNGEGFDLLLDLVDRHLVRILDLEFLVKSVDGQLSTVEVDHVATEPGVDLTAFHGSSSHLLDQSDFDTVGASMSPGSLAAILVHEELSTLPMISAWRRSGARMLAAGHLDADDIEDALDSAERE